MTRPTTTTPRMKWKFGLVKGIVVSWWQQTYANYFSYSIFYSYQFFDCDYDVSVSSILPLDLNSISQSISLIDGADWSPMYQHLKVALWPEAATTWLKIILRQGIWLDPKTGLTSLGSRIPYFIKQSDKLTGRCTRKRRMNLWLFDNMWKECYKWIVPWSYCPFWCCTSKGRAVEVVRINVSRMWMLEGA